MHNPEGQLKRELEVLTLCEMCFAGMGAVEECQHLKPPFQLPP